MDKKLRVAVYCRVDQAGEVQTLTEMQKMYYEQYISSHEDWVYSGIYFDNAPGTKNSPRPELGRLQRDCEKGKIDLIVTQSLSRLYRDMFDALSFMLKLLKLTPPVGVYIEHTGFNTLKIGAERLSCAMTLWWAKEGLNPVCPSYFSAAKPLGGQLPGKDA